MPCSRILLLRWVMARAKRPGDILAPEGSNRRNSFSRSCMVLSTDALELGLAWSPSTTSIPLLTSWLSGVAERETRALALSVLTWTLELWRIGVITWRRPIARSSLFSLPMMVAVVKFEKRSVFTNISCPALFSTSAFMWVPGCSGLGLGVKLSVA